MFSDLSNVKILYPAFLVAPLFYLLTLLQTKKVIPAISYGNIGILSAARSGLKAKIRKPFLFLNGLLVVTLLSIAASRPQIVSQIETPTESRNLMLTLDLSGSMGTVDFKTAFGYVNRLEAVKSVVADFIKARKEDRLGLVIFGTNAFLQSPLTMDHALLEEMIRRLQVGVAGEDTAIGDGLGLSLKRIQDIQGTSKAIILLTDGVNRAGQVNPIKAAGVAKDLGIKIHTIGIGSKDNPNKTRLNGFLLPGTQAAEFDEATLKKIAEITGGVYYNASSLEGLKKVYDDIDALEKSEAATPNKQVTFELYPQIAVAALISYLILVLLSRTYFLKVPL